MMVVAIHTFSISKGDMAIAIRQIFNMAVPIFLANSGYFLAKKDVSDQEKYYSFIKKHLKKIYIPCLIWSMPLFLMDIRQHSLTISAVLLFIFCGYSIYYFIALIIQYYALLPVLQKMAGRHRILKGVGILIVSLACVVSITYFMQIKGFTIPLILYAGVFPLWLIFFYEGLQLGNCHDRNYPILGLFFLAIGALVLQYIESKYLMKFNGGVGIKPSSFIFSVIMIALLFSSKFEHYSPKSGFVYKAIVFLGKISFGIYLIHYYVITVLNRIFPLITSFWVVDWLFVLVISTVIIVVVRKVAPVVSKYIGF